MIIKKNFPGCAFALTSIGYTAAGPNSGPSPLEKQKYLQYIK